MDWNGARVLITGGAGQIGSNLTERLIGMGAEITVADNLWRGKERNLLKNGAPMIDMEQQFHRVDLADKEACETVCKGQDVVIHLADVVAGINFVFGNQYFLFNKNALIDNNMIQSALDAGVSKYVYVGSACSYPADKQAVLDPPPFKEDDVYPALPESAYGWSKLMGEYLCQLAGESGKMETGVLRFHNVYGPRCEMSPEKSQVIPALIRKAIRHPQEEFVVWGSGAQRRAFVYVDDAVDGLVRVVERGMGKGAIQIGPDFSTSIKEVAEHAVAASGRDIEITFDTTKPEGDMDRAADWTKAKDILGWEPTVDVAEGIKRTYAWCDAELKALGNDGPA
ncbi:NAD-dependent epimerase/dehydratase family protein [Primorskyibacter sp. S187A]|uniref:NAD-dependent epimerase/dehydratase family protein n=1 Tax=Primorskyibacter sp. S187A TaxID=3415130 RepID=UPI003C7B4427